MMPSTGGSAVCEKNPNFPRYIAQDFPQYVCEGKNKLKKNKTEERL